MSMVECTCKTCKVKFMARSADVKRGWAKFCSKSCKAKKQEARTGQYRQYVNRPRHVDGTCFPSMAEGEVQ